MGERKKIESFEDLETGEELLFSPEYGGYGMLVDKDVISYTKPSLFNNRCVGNTSIPCFSMAFFNPVSLDQIPTSYPLDLKCMDSATYGKSFAGEISLAFDRNSINPSAGIKSICNSTIVKIA